MSNRDLSLVMRIYADTARFVSGLAQGESGLRRFGGAARRELDAVRNAASSIKGHLAAIGLSAGAVATLTQSARMDKGLTQIGQTAGVSKGEVEQLRAELFRMAGETGEAVDDLQVGFNNAVQSGLKFREALPVIDATNKAIAVTGASADRLTSALTVAANPSAFNFDLSKPGMALEILDKMTVAGRLGNAELHNLSDIFARVGVNAQSAGFSFDKTLAFIEGLSQVERQPERLATLVDSTLRLFTNQNYRDAAQKATGVKFTDAKGQHRDPIEVLKEIKSKYDKLKTDLQRDKAIHMAFGKADLDTIKGIKTLLGGDMLDKIGGEFTSAIRTAGGTLEHDLPAAIDNGINQTGRLKAELRKAADEFARPINDALQNAIKWGLDKKDKGGLELSGEQMIAGGVLGAAGIFGAARYGGKALGALAKRFGSTAAGVAEGKALEAAAGVTPVFVVNWPGGTVTGLPGMPTPAGAPGATGGGGSILRMLGSAGLGAAPLLAMYGVSNWAGDTSNDAGRIQTLGGISDGLKRVLGVFGFDKDASIAARREANRAELDGGNELKGEIRIAVDREGNVTSVRASSSGRVTMNVDNGVTMAGP